MFYGWTSRSLIWPAYELDGLFYLVAMTICLVVARGAADHVARKVLRQELSGPTAQG